MDMGGGALLHPPESLRGHDHARGRDHGHDRGRDHDHEDDLGPETSVDDGELQRQQLADLDPAVEPRQEAPTPPAALLLPGQSEPDNVADSGDDSEDEWNYYKVEHSGKSVDVESLVQTKQKVCPEPPQLPEDIFDMESRLNPDAAEFVPSPTHSKPSFEDTIISHSPVGKVLPLDDVEVPSMAEFQREICQRPGEISSEDALSESGYLPHIQKELHNGGSITDDGDLFSKKCADSEYKLTEQNLAAFTSNNPFEVSEISSTKAEYGDESAASFITSSDLLQKNLGTNASNVDSSLTETDFVASETLSFKQSQDFLGFEASNEFSEFKEGLSTALPSAFSPTKDTGAISFELQKEIAPTMEEGPERVKLTDDMISPFSHEQPIAEMPVEECEQLSELDRRSDVFNESFEHSPNFTLDAHEVSSPLNPCAPSFDYKLLGDDGSDHKLKEMEGNSVEIVQQNSTTAVSSDFLPDISVPQPVSPGPQSGLCAMEEELAFAAKDLIASDTIKAPSPDVILESELLTEKLSGTELLDDYCYRSNEHEAAGAVPGEMLEKFNQLSDEVREEFEKSADLMEELYKESTKELLEEVHKESTKELLEELHKESTKELLEELHKEPAKELLEELHKEPAKELLEELHREPAEELLEELHREPAEELLEEVPKEPTEELPEEVPKEPTEELPEKVPKEPTEELPEEVPKEPAEELPEEVPKEPAEELPEEVPKEPAEELPEEIHKELPEEQIHKEPKELEKALPVEQKEMIEDLHQETTGIMGKIHKEPAEVAGELHKEPAEVAEELQLHKEPTEFGGELHGAQLEPLEELQPADRTEEYHRTPAHMEEEHKEFVEELHKAHTELMADVQKVQDDIAEQLKDDIAEQLKDDIAEQLKDDIAEQLKDDLVLECQKAASDVMESVEKITDDLVEHEHKTDTETPGLIKELKREYLEADLPELHNLSAFLQSDTAQAGDQLEEVASLTAALNNSSVPHDEVHSEKTVLDDGIISSEVCSFHQGETVHSSEQHIPHAQELLGTDTSSPYVSDIPEALRVCVYPLPVKQKDMEDDVELISPTHESQEVRQEQSEKEVIEVGGFVTHLTPETLSGEQRDMVETMLNKESNKTEFEALKDIASITGDGAASVTGSAQYHFNDMGTETVTQEKTETVAEKAVEREALLTVKEHETSNEEVKLANDITLEFYGGGASEVKIDSETSVLDGEPSRDVSAQELDVEEVPSVTQTPPPTPASQAELTVDRDTSEAKITAGNLSAQSAATAVAVAVAAAAGVAATAATVSTKKEPASKKQVTAATKDVKKTPVAKESEKVKSATKPAVRHSTGTVKMAAKTSPTSPTKLSVASTPRTSTPKKTQSVTPTTTTTAKTAGKAPVTKPLSRPASNTATKPASLISQKSPLTTATAKVSPASSAPKAASKTSSSVSARPSPTPRAVTAPKPRVSATTSTSAVKTPLTNGEIKPAETRKSLIGAAKTAPRSHTAPPRTTVAPKTATTATNLTKTGVQSRTGLSNRTSVPNGVASKPRVTSSTAPSRPATNLQSVSEKQHKETANKHISARRVGTLPQKTAPAKVGMKKPLPNTKGGKAPPPSANGGSPLISTGAGDEKKKDPLL